MSAANPNINYPPSDRVVANLSIRASWSTHCWASQAHPNLPSRVSYLRAILQAFAVLNPQILQNHLATYVRCLPRFIISRLRPAIPVAPARDLKRLSLNTKQIDLDIDKLKARHAPVDLQVEGTANAAG